MLDFDATNFMRKPDDIWVLKSDKISIIFHLFFIKQGYFIPGKKVWRMKTNDIKKICL